MRSSPGLCLSLPVAAAASFFCFSWNAAECQLVLMHRAGQDVQAGHAFTEKSLIMTLPASVSFVLYSLLILTLPRPSQAMPRIACCRNTLAVGLMHTAGKFGRDV